MGKRYRVTAITHTINACSDDRCLERSPRVGDKVHWVYGQTPHITTFADIESVEELPEPMSAEDALAEIGKLPAVSGSWVSDQIRDILSRYERSRG